VLVLRQHAQLEGEQLQDDWGTVLGSPKALLQYTYGYMYYVTTSMPGLHAARLCCELYPGYLFWTAIMWISQHDCRLLRHDL
jgi:hypothetical protein